MKITRKEFQLIQIALETLAREDENIIEDLDRENLGSLSTAYDNELKSIRELLKRISHFLYSNEYANKN